MMYEVRLEIFEGPLDLLLHLIHKNEINLSDIPMALITGQYLETIELMQSLNLDVAGEYLLMAAYLTHIKSQMLLPIISDAESQDEVPDPRQELVEHLLEYKRYKEVAEGLAGFSILDRDVFIREDQDGDAEFPKNMEELSVSLADLLEAFRTVVSKTARRDLIELEPERLLVKDKINEILEILQQNESILFESLFTKDKSKLNLLTNFLALLELVKLQLVSVYQEKAFGSILMKRVFTASHGD